MLVNFLLDPEAFKESLDWMKADAFAAHRRLLHLWLRFGVLLYEGSTFAESSFSAALSAMPVAIADLYQQAIKNRRLRMKPAPATWCGCHLIEDAQDLCQLCGSVDVVSLSSFFAEMVGLADEEFSGEMFERRLEVVRLNAIDQSANFRRAELTARSRIEPGITVLDLWESRFAAIAKFARQIAIVDRYAGESYWLHRRNGLHRFLTQIDASATNSTITFYTGQKDAETAELLEGITTLGLSCRARGGIREIKIVVTPDDFYMGKRRSVFPEGSHDRFVRFDDTVINLGNGVSVFDGSNVEKNCTFQMTDRSNVEDKIETALRRNATARSHPL